MLLRRSLQWPSLAILATVLVSVGHVGVLAQSSTAVCLSEFNWMDNSKNQSPCLLTAYLQGACNGGQFTVDPLPPNTHYTGPYVDEQNPCQCSSVTYNAISACGLCQNHTIIGWTVWNFNCSTVYPGVFPPGVPDGTAVPQWAFQDVTTSNMFNATLAQSVGDNPESTASHPQSTGSTILTTTSDSGSITPSPSDSGSTSSGGGSKSNTAAIAGGVVGGVVGVVVIVGAVVILVMRKKRSQTPPSARFTASQVTPTVPSAVYSDAPLFPPQMTQPKLYDPSDPSTFPASPPPTTIMTGSSNDIPHSPIHSQSTNSIRPGGFYSGVPEI